MRAIAKVNWNSIRVEYETTDATMKDLAKKYHVKPNTVRAHKSREKWQRQKHTTNKHLTSRSERRRSARMQSRHLIKNDDLTDKQKKFCLDYLTTYNATQSYMRVYDCQYLTAKTNGIRLLSNPKIKKAINAIKQQQFSDLYLNSSDILLELAREAFSDIGNYVTFGHKTDYDDDNNSFERSYLYFNNQKGVDTSLIDSIHIGQNGAEIKLPDKQRALKLLLDNLPEQSNGTSKDNTFLKALIESEKKLNGNDKK